MLFSSFTFIFAFLPIVWVVFHLLKKARFKSHYKVAKIFLIFSSLFFYAFWKVAYLPILLSSILVNYTLAKAILKSNSKVSSSNTTTLGGGGNHYLDSNALETNSRFTPKFYFILGIIFNLCLLAFFKYTDFLLENFNAFSKLAHLDFDIPLPHILLPLALSFVTFQQIAFLFDCYKRTKGELDENLHIDFIDYALFISFFPQLIAGPIVHHREMMPQFARLSNSSLTQSSRELEKSAFNRQQVLFQADFPTQPTNLTQDTRIANDSSEFASCNGIAKSNNPSLRGESMDSPKQSTINYEYLAKGIFIFSIGLFKKAFIADSFAKWANAGFSVVESGGMLNIAESWATSLSYTFQLYFDFSGYCDMAIGLALMFGIVLPLNFDSPYKSLNISEFWRRWHITLGRFLKECLYIPLGGNRVSKILNLRNLFIVAFLSGIWHGAGWGFVIWGVLHGMAMIVHRIYLWIHQSLNKTNALIKFMQTKSYKVFCWFITFNFVNLAWIFFRAENLNGAVNLIKGMFGFVNLEIPHKWSKIFSALQSGTNEIIIWIVCAFVVCLIFKNSNQITQKIKISHCIIAGFTFALCIFTMLSNTTYKAPFLYFNF